MERLGILGAAVMAMVLMFSLVKAGAAAEDGPGDRRDRPGPGLARPTKTVVYKQVGDVQLVLHVFEPSPDKAKGKRPAIVFFHGGVWQSGSPQQFYWQCAYLAKRGMWAASAQYRLTPSGVKVADCVADAKDAVRYVRTHAEELGVDPARIAAGGGSSGGHLAAAAGILTEEKREGAVSGRPNLLVLFNPALFHPRGQDTLKIEDFTKDAPPAIHFYGTKDPMLQYGKDVLERSKQMGFEMGVYAGKDVDHGFFNNPPWREGTIIEADRFLVQHGYLEGAPTVEMPVGAQLQEIK